MLEHFGIAKIVTNYDLDEEAFCGWAMRADGTVVYEVSHCSNGAAARLRLERMIRQGGEIDDNECEYLQNRRYSR